MAGESERPISFSRASWMLIRQAFLMVVDALERELDVTPRTAELRREKKAQKKEQAKWHTDGMGYRYPDNEAAVEEMQKKPLRKIL